MQGVKRWGKNKIVDHLKPLVDIGLRAVLLFAVPNPNVKVMYNYHLTF